MMSKKKSDHKDSNNNEAPPVARNANNTVLATTMDVREGPITTIKQSNFVPANKGGTQQVNAAVAARAANNKT
jgi:hypothetical protein